MIERKIEVFNFWTSIELNSIKNGIGNEETMN